MGALLLISVGVTPSAHASDLSINDVKTIAAAEAVSHNVRDIPGFLGTLQIEAGFDINTPPSDGGTSYGVCRFHNPVTDWGMTIAQAEDPYYCLDRMASYWQTHTDKQLQRKWGGYREYLAENAP